MADPKNIRPYRELFSSLKHLPFLFVGSGLPRRYLDLPNWEDLLRLFAAKIHPGNPLALEVFVNQASGQGWPAISSLIETEFNKLWLTSAEYVDQRSQHQQEVRAGVSPFKLELAEFFSSARKPAATAHLKDELACLADVGKRSVAGVITTNYDLLLEDIFKGYTPFIGQEQLLFGATQGVSEIYKIHGCCTQPGSIVITADDYADFDRRNAYLAAKLLTVFVEHPIIFLGYSLSDPNIQSILAAIIDCLSVKNLEMLKQRLVFVEYSPTAGLAPRISEHSVSFHGGTRSVKMTKITLNDFLPLYTEMLGQKYQYNPKLLRQLKRDIYKLVTTNESVDRFQIQDIEDDDALDQVGVLAGVGVIHRMPEPFELFRDVVFDDGNFNLKSLVEDALVKLQKSHSHALPVHKYVHAYRQQAGLEPPAALLADCKSSWEELLSSHLLKQRGAQPLATLDELQQQAPNWEKWVELFPRLKDPAANLPGLEKILRDCLTERPDMLTSGKQTDRTNLKRVIRIYDWLKHGTKKDAQVS